MKQILLSVLAVLLLAKVLVLTTGCGQIMSPTGGKRDSLPPVLVTATPPAGSTNFKGNRITMNFDEYIVIDQLRENLLVSPTAKNDPYVDYKLKTVSVKIRDTLEPNTTYSIDFGNAIRDNNEGNILRRFSYVFSTGPVIDSLTFAGKVMLAETGRSDSTLQVYLYKNLDDSAVQKQKPRYIARLDSSGRFLFRNLPGGTYNVFAIKDGDGSKTYNSKIEPFAFADSTVNITTDVKPVNLFAYAEEKEKPKVTKSTSPVEKKLKYSTRVTAEKQDILNNLTIEFNKPLRNFDSAKIFLTDTLNNIYKEAGVSRDSTGKGIIVKNKWLPGAAYRLVILKDFGSDSTGLALEKTDTIRFLTRTEADYGVLKINFTNFNQSRNHVLQFIKNNEVVKSYPVTAQHWTVPLFDPGDYELRVLYDDNGNGLWDPGNYLKRIQPEKVYAIPQKLNIRANWENERDIEIGYY